METASRSSGADVGQRNLYVGIGLVLVLGLAAFNHHISAQWHQDKWRFDALSEAEQRGTFFLDGAFYYNFYDELVSAEDDDTALRRLTANDRVEHPNTVNALRRFSLSTELALGMAWRWLAADRTRGAPGFYVDAILLFNGLVVLFLFLLALAITRSVPAAVMACLYYIFHRLEVSRVVGMPSLRENVSVVWLVAQVFVLSRLLVAEHRQRTWQALLVVATALHALTWQFGQFTLLVEAGLLLLMYLGGGLPLARLRRIFVAYVIAVVVAWALHLGNMALLTSSWAIFSVAVLALFRTEVGEPRPNSPGQSALRQTAIRLAGVAGLLVAGRWLVDSVFGLGSTTHVFGFIGHRLWGGGDLDAMLYHCHPAFTPISGDQVFFFAQSGMLVVAGGAALAVLVGAIRRRDVRPDVVLVVLLAGCFAALAVLANRFVVLAGTLACVLAALPFSAPWRDQLMATLGLQARRAKAGRAVSWVLLAAAVVVLFAVGVPRVQLLLNVPYPQRPDRDIRQMTDWIAEHTPPDAVVAADMGVSASVRLLSGRKTVIHPHYEHAALRRRVQRVYQVYGRKPPAEVHRTLSQLGADYLLLDFPSCLRPLPYSQCRLGDLAAIGEPEHAPGTPPFCAALPSRTPWFKEIFINRSARLFRVLPAAVDPVARPVP